MNPFDSNILRFASELTSRSPGFDLMVIAVDGSYSLRLVPLTILWWIWFRNGPSAQRDREIVVSTIVACFVALLFGRLLALGLPFRLRPFANPELGLTFPGDAASRVLRTWSAFPSDHAMMWFALATGIFMASRRLGLFTLAYVLALICIPRVLLGLHHPTDILGGAVIGMAICTALNCTALRGRVAIRILDRATGHEGAFNVAIFLVGFELASQFEEIRVWGGLVLRHL
jgi:membrane-associated phospholipid phosphatase